MRDVNKLILIGRLGADPIKRETKNGLAVAHFSVATGHANNETQWHQVVAWGRDADHCTQYLRKGAPVYVEGSVKTRRYEGKDGAQRTAFEVSASVVSFLGYPRNQEVAEGGATSIVPTAETTEMVSSPA